MQCTNSFCLSEKDMWLASCLYHSLPDCNVNTGGRFKQEIRFYNCRINLFFKTLFWMASWAPPWSSGSVLDHRSLQPVFESRRGHIWRLFRFSLCLITFGSRSAHLAYLVHKSGHKTSTIINHHHFGWPDQAQKNHTYDYSFTLIIGMIEK